MLKVLRRYYWLFALLVCGLFALVAFGWMPGAIRAAHGGGGIGLLRRAMEQASRNPVQGYLDQWDTFARLQLYHLASAFLLGYLLYAAALAALGSVCNTLKEAQSLMMPVTMVLVLPMMGWM